MKSFSKYIFIVVLIFCFSGMTAQNLNTKVEAGIKTNDVENGMLEITGVATSLTETTYSLRYELSVISTTGKNNSSKNSQSGKFTLGPFETKSLSQTSVHINPEMKTTILLLIYNNEDDKLLGTDRKEYDLTESKKKENEMSYSKPNEGIVLKGMVTENTKTKPGKDFYDFFYQKYSLNPEKGNKIIQIDEMISFGRTTKIMVKIEDQIVYQFYARPKLDFLEDKATQALSQVNRYFEYLKNRNESNRQY
ncbi:Curli assembly protein CsgE [Gillisia sp. Hel_I_86]|uniref:curli-like amyloid fiber formation chaperone CsgH n=1 Tax=Gillisia sp. Hel_I_86 TaxID=1249981 RepID=UPI00119A8C14|nr:curli-like amyloid fiber formation chaperone CsgH [Gillisia sp. Hel_I_86]TVZ25662.1 Curli assembly protein CsgE [Gillisia sp. Hel_I_86]